MYEMVYRNDEKHCPKSVTRSQSCLCHVIVNNTTGRRTYHCIISQIHVPSCTAGRLAINVVGSLKEKGL